MAAKSKNKGKGFERDLCKIFRELYNENFERVPNSGAFVGGKNAFRKSSLTEGQIRGTKGDIIPPDDWKYFNCEAKNYADFPFHHLVQNKEIPVLEQWLEQTQDAHDEGDLDMLFMKFDRKGIYWCIPKDLFFMFDIPRYVVYTSKKYGDWVFTFWTDIAASEDNIKKIRELATSGVDQGSK